MRKTRKPLIAAMCALVLALGVNATYAWLTDEESVTNTFTVGSIDITLEESDDLDLKMVPGCTITKDPVVTVLEGSEDCWLFVKVNESTNLDSYITYVVDAGWTELTEGSGIYYREAKASDSFSVLANDQVVVNAGVTKTKMDSLIEKNSDGSLKVENGAYVLDEEMLPTLTFTAYAVQKAGFATAGEAWTNTFGA